MINNLSKQLLDKFQNLELERFIINKKPEIGTLAKQARIQKNFKSIYSFISTRENSICTINNADRTLSINISTVEYDNDHVKMYLITLDETCETYQADRVISHERSTVENIKQFESKEFNEDE
jgi:hypothetical protein